MMTFRFNKSQLLTFLLALVFSTALNAQAWKPGKGQRVQKSLENHDQGSAKITVFLR